MEHSNTSSDAVPVDTKKKYSVISAVLFIAAAVCLAAAFLLPKRDNGDGFGASDSFIENYAAYCCKMGEYGYAVTDFGCSRVLISDKNGLISHSISGLPFQADGGYIADVAADENGNIYVQYVMTDINSYSTLYETICKYDRNGRFVKELFRADYSEAEQVPHRDPRINGITVCGTDLYFAFIDSGNIRFIKADTESAVVSEYYRNSADEVDFRYLRFFFYEDGSCAYIKRTGEVGIMAPDGSETVYANFDFDINAGGVLPIYIFGTSEALYIADDCSCSIMKILPDGSCSVAVDESVLDGLSYNGISYLTGSGTQLMGVSGGVPFIADTSDGTGRYLGQPFKVSPSVYAIKYVRYLLYALSALTFAAGIVMLITKVFKKRISLFVKQIALIIPTITIVMFITVSFMYSKLESTIISDITVQTESFCVATTGYFDGDKIASLTGTDCIDTEEFREVRSTQKEILNDNKDPWNALYYDAIYIVNGSSRYLLTISNDSYANYMWFDSLTAGSDNEKKFLSGKPVTEQVSDFEGTWIDVQMPIFNSEGEFVAIHEVGADMANLKKQTGEILRSTITKAILCLPFIILSVCAITFFTIMHLKKTGQIVEKIASGDLSVRMKYISRDELGDISTGVNKMAENLSTSFSNIANLKDCYFKFVPIQFMHLLGKQNITEIKLGDAKCLDMTILFFDIRSFSLNSEMMTAENIFHLVNEVAGKAVPIITMHNGFVDKYIGDAVMALFTNADDAVRAGIELYHEIVLDPENSVKIGDDSINIGIGVHSGMSMVGIIGEENRLSSTVISENVNMSSRLESLTKQYRTGMIISKDTLDRMDERSMPNMRFLGMIQVAGVHEVKALFEVLDALDDKRRDARLKTKEDFESGIRKYHLGKPEEALVCLERVQKADPDDIAVAKYISVIREQIENGSADTNVFRFSNK
ncbi:MAG: adenylate/guanylate cyclase domain-containing protein [Huintestinicola sp.]